MSLSLSLLGFWIRGDGLTGHGRGTAAVFCARAQLVSNTSLFTHHRRLVTTTISPQRTVVLTPPCST
ncbi:hypothetical protein VTO73DRAFT_7470 [Trametes versicolor]